MGRQRHGLHGRPGGHAPLEVGAVRCVHGRVVVHVRQVDVTLHEVLETETGGRQDRADAVHRLTRLHVHRRRRGAAAGQTELPGDVQRLPHHHAG